MDLLQIVFLTLLGFVLIFLDLAVIPGAVLLLGGTGVIFYSIYLNYQSFGLGWALLHFLACLAVVPKLIGWSMGRLALKKELDSADGYVGVDDYSSYLGLEGRAVSDLRPSGSVAVTIQGEEVRLDCISEGGYIESGMPVVVAEKRGPSLVVRKRETGAESSPAAR